MYTTIGIIVIAGILILIGYSLYINHNSSRIITASKMPVEELKQKAVKAHSIDESDVKVGQYWIRKESENPFDDDDNFFYKVLEIKGDWVKYAFEDNIEKLKTGKLNITNSCKISTFIYNKVLLENN